MPKRSKKQMKAIHAKKRHKKHKGHKYDLPSGRYAEGYDKDKTVGDGEAKGFFQGKESLL